MTRRTCWYVKEDYNAADKVSQRKWTLIPEKTAATDLLNRDCGGLYLGIYFFPGQINPEQS
ncbi:MAG: hypothetical protein ABFD50_22870 [Smithella sp.]